MNIAPILIGIKPEFLYVFIFIAAFIVNRSIAASVFFAARCEAETNDSCEDYFFHEDKINK